MTVVLGDGDKRLEISITEVEAPTPHSTGGDVRLAVRVTHGDFAGATDTWVLLETWDAFLGTLRTLERHRRGEARVHGISPGELVLRIFATDRAGHLAVEGEVGQLGAGWEARLKFPPIAFDPSLLPRLIAELAD